MKKYASCVILLLVIFIIFYILPYGTYVLFSPFGLLVMALIIVFAVVGREGEKPVPRMFPA